MKIVGRRRPSPLSSNQRSWFHTQSTQLGLQGSQALLSAFGALAFLSGNAGGFFSPLPFLFARCRS